MLHVQDRDDDIMEFWRESYGRPKSNLSVEKDQKFDLLNELL